MLITIHAPAAEQPPAIPAAVVVELVAANRVDDKRNRPGQCKPQRGRPRRQASPAPRSKGAAACTEVRAAMSGSQTCPAARPRIVVSPAASQNPADRYELGNKSITSPLLHGLRPSA